MNFDKLDRINLSKDDVGKLVEWQRKNDELKHTRAVMEEGLVILEGAFDVHFKVSGLENVIFEVYLDGNKVFSFVYNKITSECDGMIQSPLYEQHSEKVEKLSEHLAFMYMSLMSYMENNKNYVEKSRENVKRTKKKTKKNKKPQKRLTKITRTLYKVNIKDNENTNSGKREYTRQIDGSWNVRGYWRTLKNGKKTWVRSHERGNGKKQPKTYKL